MFPIPIALLLLLWHGPTQAPRLMQLGLLPDHALAGYIRQANAGTDHQSLAGIKAKVAVKLGRQILVSNGSSAQTRSEAPVSALDPGAYSEDHSRDGPQS